MNHLANLPLNIYGFEYLHSFLSVYKNQIATLFYAKAEDQPLHFVIFFPITNINFSDTQSIAYLIKETLFGQLSSPQSDLSHFFMQTMIQLDEVTMTFDYLKFQFTQHIPQINGFASALKKIIELIYFPKFQLGVDKLNELQIRINQNMPHSEIISSMFKKNIVTGFKLSLPSCIKFLEIFWKQHIHAKQFKILLTGPSDEYTVITGDILKDFIHYCKVRDKIKQFKTEEPLIEKVKDETIPPFSCHMFKSNLVSSSQFMNYVNIVISCWCGKISNLLVFNTLRLGYCDWILDPDGPLVSQLTRFQNQKGNQVFPSSLFQNQSYEIIVIDGEILVIFQFSQIPEIYTELLINQLTLILQTQFNVVRSSQVGRLNEIIYQKVSLVQKLSLFDRILNDIIYSSLDQYSFSQTGATEVYGPMQLFSIKKCVTVINYWSCFASSFFNKLRDSNFVYSDFSSKFLSLYGYLNIASQQKFLDTDIDPIQPCIQSEVFINPDVAWMNPTTKQDCFSIFVSLGQLDRNFMVLQSLNEWSLFISAFNQQIIFQSTISFSCISSYQFNPTSKIIKLLNNQDNAYTEIIDYYQYLKIEDYTFDYSKIDQFRQLLFYQEVFLKDEEIELNEKNSYIKNVTPLVGKSQITESKFKKDIYQQMFRYYQQLQKISGFHQIYIKNDCITNPTKFKIDLNSQLNNIGIEIFQKHIPYSLIDYLKHLTDVQYNQVLMKYHNEMYLIQAMRNDIIIPIQQDQIYEEQKCFLQIQFVFDIGYLPTNLYPYLAILINVLQMKAAQFQSNIKIQMEYKNIIINTDYCTLKLLSDMLIFLRQQIFGYGLQLLDFAIFIADYQRLEEYFQLCAKLHQILFLRNRMKTNIKVQQLFGKSNSIIINDYCNSLLTYQINYALQQLSILFNTFPNIIPKTTYQKCNNYNYLVKTKTNDVDQFHNLYFIYINLEEMSNNSKTLLKEYFKHSITTTLNTVVVDIQLLYSVIVIKIRCSFSVYKQLVTNLQNSFQITDHDELLIIQNYVFSDVFNCQHFDSQTINEIRAFASVDQSQISCSIVIKAANEMQFVKDIQDFQMDDFQVVSNYDQFSQLELLIQHLNYLSLQSDMESAQICLVLLTTLCLNVQSQYVLQNYRIKLQSVQQQTEQLSALVQMTDFKTQLMNSSSSNMTQKQFQLIQKQHRQLVTRNQYFNIVSNTHTIDRSQQILVLEELRNKSKKMKQSELFGLNNQIQKEIMNVFCSLNYYLFDISSSQLINGIPIEVTGIFGKAAEGELYSMSIVGDKSFKCLSQHMQFAIANRLCFPVESAFYLLSQQLNILSQIVNKPLKYNICLDCLHSGLINHDNFTHSVVLPLIYNSVSYTTDVFPYSPILLKSINSIGKILSQIHSLLGKTNADEGKLPSFLDVGVMSPQIQQILTLVLITENISQLVGELDVSIKDSEVISKTKILEVMIEILRHILTEKQDVV